MIRYLVLMSFVVSLVVTPAQARDYTMLNKTSPKKDPAKAAESEAAKAAEKRDQMLKTAFQPGMFEACKNVSFVAPDAFDKDSSYWKEVVRQCGPDGSIQLLPDSGFFTVTRQESPSRDILGAVSSYAFLESVGEATKKNLNSNIAILSSLEACFKHGYLNDESGSLSPEAQKQSCEAHKAKVRALMREKLPELRGKLAVMHVGKDLTNMAEIEKAIATKRGGFFTNYKLESGGGFFSSGAIVGKNLKPLEQSEIFAAENTWDKAVRTAVEKYEKQEADKLAEFRKKYGDIERSSGAVMMELENFKRRLHPSSVPFKQFVMNELQKQNAKHVADYHKLLGQSLILGVEANPDASNGELAKAFGELASNAREELKRVNKALESQKVTLRGGVKPNAGDMYDFMKNVPVIEELLAKDPKNCAVAQGLVNHVASSDSRESAAIMAGMVALGFGTMGLGVLPAGAGGTVLMTAATATRVGAVLGAGSGMGYTFVHSRGKLTALEQKTFSSGSTEGEKAIGDVKKLVEAREGYATEVALSPLNLMGTGFVGAALSGTARRAASTAILRMQGLESQEAKKLIQLAASEDKVIAAQAQKQLNATSKAWWDDLFGRTPTAEEQHLVDRAAAKGFDKQKYADELAKTINNLANREQRRKFVADAAKAIERIDSSKLNELNRMDVLENIVAASRFGMKDPERAALLLNDWIVEGTDGVKGLTKVYQRATAIKISGRGLAGIADETARMDAAFAQASRQLVDEHPQLKNLSPLEKDQLVARMCTCPGFCKK